MDESGSDMVAVFTGNGLGMFQSSLSQLGVGLGGNAGLGQSRDSQYVNASNGNLVLSGFDESLFGHGFATGLVRTYNSQGSFAQVGADGWMTGYERTVRLVSGTVNTTGSSVERAAADGSVVTYTWDATKSAYASTAGEGAHDTIVLSGSGATAKWLWTEGSTQVQETYDASTLGGFGRLEKIVELSTNATYTLAYTGTLLTTITGTNGETLEFGYDASNRLVSLSTRERDAAGTLVLKGQVSYGYDAAGRLSWVQTDLTPDNATDNTWDAVTAANNNGKSYRTTYTYADSTSLRIVGVATSDGVTVAFTYDANGRIASVTQGGAADGSTQSLTYTYAAGATTVTDAANRSWTYQYDAAGQLTAVLEPTVGGQRAVTEYTYDAAGNVTRIRQAAYAGAASTLDAVYQYDASGNVILQRDRLGNTVTRTYNSANRVLTEARYTAPDADGLDPTHAGTTNVPSGALITRYVYDDANPRLLRFVINAAGEVTETQYNASGVAQGLASLTRRVEGATYDTSALTATQVPTSATMSTWVSGKLAQTQRTDFAYDAQGRLSQQTGYATVNSSGVGVLDAGTSITRFTYDAQGLLRQQLIVHGTTRTVAGAAPAGSEVVDYVYDGLGRLLSSIRRASETAANDDANTIVTTTAYADASRQIVTTFDSGMVRTEARNAAGMLVSVSEAGTVSGATVTCTTQNIYDSTGRLRAVQDASGARSYFFYDAAGRLVATVDATGAVTQTQYDAIGRVSGATSYAIRVNTSAWYAAGAVTKTTLVFSATSPALAGTEAWVQTDAANDRLATRTYDAAGRLETEIDAVGLTTAYVYDGAGRLLSSTVSKPGDATVTPRVTRFFYDAVDRLIGTLDPAGYLTVSTYDTGGRLTKITRYATLVNSAYQVSGTLAQLQPVADATNDQIERFLYDGRGNQVGTVDAEGYFTEFVYDEAANQRAVKAYAKKLTGLTGTETLASLRTLALTSAPTESSRQTVRTFNGRGQLVTELNAEGTVTRYSYDEAGRLVRTEAAQGTTEVRENFSRYDVFGQLIGEMSGVQAANAAAALGKSLNDPTLTEAQLDSAYAQYGVRHAYNLLGQRTESTDASGAKTFYFYDAVGRQTFTVRGVKDANGIANAQGEVTETRYTAFGQVSDVLAYTGRITIATPGSWASVQSAVSTLSFVAATDTRRQFVYDKRGLLTRLTDAEGAQTARSYTAFGQLYEETTAYGTSLAATTRYTYGLRGFLLNRVDAQGTTSARTTSQTVDAFGRTLTITDPSGVVTSFTYDRLGRQLSLSRSISGQVESMSTAYDAFDRVVSQTDARGYVTTYVHSDTARSMVMTTPEGVAITTVHNRFGQTVTVSQPIPGGGTATTTTNYDKNGAVLSVVDPLLNTAVGNVYDVRGLLTETTDAAGRKVQYTYDAAGRVLTRVEDPGTGKLNLTTTYSYDGQGRQLKVTDASGRVTQMSYDREGRLTQVAKDPTGLNLRTMTAYDAAGRVVTVTEGYGTSAASTVQYAYDALNRRTSETIDPGAGKLNLTTSYAYDANDNLVTRTDALGKVTRYAYDGAGRLRFVVDATGAITETVYDKNGNAVLTRGYAKALSASAFSALATAPSVATLQGLVTSESLKNDAVDQLAYQVFDRDNRARFTLDAVGTLTETRYDSTGRVQQVLAYGTAFVDATVLAKLRAGTAVVGDFASFVTANEAAARASQSVYDAAGRLVYTLVRSDATQAVVTERRYDASGMVIADVAYAKTITYAVGLTKAQVASAITTAGGDAAGQQRLTRYAYDGAGRLRFTVDDAGGVVEQRYDAAGRVESTRAYATAVTVTTLTEAAVAALVAGQGNVQRTSYVYDNAGRLFSTTDALNQTETYGYDAAGHRTSLTNKLGATWTYEYDAAGRLTAERSPLVNVAKYDANGNIVVSNVSIVTRRTYDALGQVLTVTENADTAEARTVTYQYDARGRQIKTIFPDAWQLDANGNLVATGVQPQINVTYDTLDRAVVQKDVRGNYSYKVYDSQGQLKYDIDEAGYVTAYTYNAFGEQTGLTRYASKIDFTKLTGWSAGQAITLAQMGTTGVLTANAAADRTLTTAYDRLGQKASITQSSVSYYKANGTLTTGTPVTQFVYDAYGNLVKESQLLEGTPGQADAVWADTYRYYDELGRQTLAVDAEGYVTTWQYDALGQVLGQTEFARKISTSVLVVGTMPALPATGDSGTGYDRSVVFQYDVLGRKVAEIAQHLYQSSTGANGMRLVTTNYGYDAESRLTSTSIDGVMNNALAYDALGRTLSSTEIQRKVLRSDWQAVLTANPNLSLSDAAMYVDASPYTTMEYDAFGNAIRVVRYAAGDPAGSALPNAGDAANAVTTMRYDLQGRAVITKDATGTKWYSKYDAADHVVDTWYTLAGSSGNATVHSVATYDEVGRQLTSVTTRLLSSTGATVTDAQSAVQYNAFGEITAKGETLASLGSATTSARYTYDAAGRITTSNADTGTIRSYYYDLAGRQVREERLWTDGTTAATAVYLTKFDKLGRAITQIMPSWKADANATTQVNFTLDRWGNVLRQIDARGYITDNFYNDRNQLVRQLAPRVKVVDETGAETWQTPETRWMYDALGHLIAARDANNNIKRYEYDAAGQLVTSTDATMAITRQGYDVRGRSVAAQDAVGYITFIDYDGLDRATAQGDFLLNVTGSARTKTTLQAYLLNQNGDRLQVTDATGRWNLYDYDSRSLLTRSQTMEGVVRAMGYDAQGRKIVDTDGVGNSNTWLYDYFGRLSDHDDLGGADYDYVYDARSGLQTNVTSSRTTVEHVAPGGRYDEIDPAYDEFEEIVLTEQILNRTTEYYANGQVRRINDPNGIYYYFEYDAAGNRTLEETKTVDGQGKVVHTITRTAYDSHNRISRVTTQDLAAGGQYTLDLTYDYDAVGNRRRVVANSAYGTNASPLTISNAAPVLVAPPANRTLKSGSIVEWTLDASSYFNDPDGTPLSYALTQANGSAIPTWLHMSYDIATGQLRFQADAGSVAALGQSFTLRLTATDSPTLYAPMSVSADFTLSVVSNTAPTAKSSDTLAIYAKAGQLYTQEFPASEYFLDPDVGDILSMSVDPISAGLSSWLNIDTSTPGVVRLSGTPTQTGTYTLTLRVRDGSNAEATKAVQLQVVAAQAPLPKTVPTQTVVDQHAFILEFTKDALFADADDFSIAASLSNGSALPSWLSAQYLRDEIPPKFRLMGTPPAGAGDLTIRLTATDTDSMSSSLTFLLDVTPNQAPQALTGTLNETARSGTAYTKSWPASSLFSDPEGDALTYSLVFPDSRGEWLSFTMANGNLTLSGTPAESQIGNYSVILRATDAFGVTRDLQIAFAVASINNPPIVVTPIPDQTATANGLTWSYIFPTGTFSDPEGLPLNYTATGMPSWMTFTASTRKFSGVPSTAGSWSVTVTATDSYGVAVTDTFTVTTPNVAPYVVTPIPDQTIAAGQAWSYAVPAATFADRNGQTLSYSASGMPGWMTFNAGTRTFSGTGTTVGSWAITVTASDGSLTKTDTFTVSVANAAPVVANPIPDTQYAVAGTYFSYTIPANTFSDANGDVLTYSAHHWVEIYDYDPYTGEPISYWEDQGIPAWLTFNASTRQFTGTPPYADGIDIEVWATDPSGTTAGVSFSLVVATAPPIVSTPIPDQTANATGGVWSYTLPTGTFTDPDGGTLTYTASGMPAWMYFNASTRTFSGTPQAVGSWNVTVTATDPSGAAVSDTFAVTTPNVAPYIVTAIPDRTAAVGQAWTYTFPAFGDRNGQGLTYTLSGAPAWMSFNAATRTLSGTPSGAATYTLTVTASDGSLTVSDSFVLTVSAVPPVNNAPVVNRPLVDQTDGLGDLYYTFAADTFVDPDGDTLTYTTSSLPVGITFDPATRTFEGYASGGKYGRNYVITVTANDGNGHTVSDSFNYYVEGSMDPMMASGSGGTYAAMSASESQMEADQQAMMLPPDDPEDPGDPPGGGGTPPPTTPNTQTLWFTYDAENRVQVVNGALVNGQIVVAAKQAGAKVESYALQYDAAGHAVGRTTVTATGTTQITQSTYNQRGQLELEYATVNLGATTGVVAKHTYDAAGRETDVTEYYAPGTEQHYHVGNPKTDSVEYYDVDVSGWRKHQTKTTYNNDGQVALVEEYGRPTAANALWAQTTDPALTWQSTVHYQDAGFDGYDAAGRLTRYSYQTSNHTDTYYTYYEARDTYLEASVTGSSDNTNYKTTTTYSTYDTIGRRVAIQQNTSGVSPVVRYFSYDANGGILTRRDGWLNNYSAFMETFNNRQYFTYANGQQLVTLGQDGSIDAASQLTAFDSSTMGTEAAMVLEGDTLQSIAQRVYGNSSLWYVLAAANAVTDADLVAGTTLKAPEVKTTANDASTFKPYDPSAIEGPTTPSLPYITPPPKQGGGCKKLVVSLLATVIRVVSQYVGVVVSKIPVVAWLGPIIGAAGEIDAQLVEKWGGVRDKFDWAQVAIAAVSVLIAGRIGPGASSGATAEGAVSAGAAGAGASASGAAASSGLSFSNAGYAGLRAAASYGANYAIRRAFGQDVHFSWRGLAASVVTAAVTSGVSEKLGFGTPGPGGSGSFWKDVGSSVTGALVSHSVHRAFGFDVQLDYRQVAVDAFGNALGNSIGRYVGGKVENGLRAWERRRVGASLSKVGKLEVPKFEIDSGKLELLPPPILPGSSTMGGADRYAGSRTFQGLPVLPGLDLPLTADEIYANSARQQLRSGVMPGEVPYSIWYSHKQMFGDEYDVLMPNRSGNHDESVAWIDNQHSPAELSLGAHDKIFVEVPADKIMIDEPVNVVDAVGKAWEDAPGDAKDWLYDRVLNASNGVSAGLWSAAYAVAAVAQPALQTPGFLTRSIANRDYRVDAVLGVAHALQNPRATLTAWWQADRETKLVSVANLLMGGVAGGRSLARALNHVEGSVGLSFRGMQALERGWSFERVANGVELGPSLPRLSTYQERLAKTPISGGQWTGVRGESSFIFDDPEVRTILPDGLAYRDSYADFSPVALHEVQLPGVLSLDRKANFSAANQILAERLGISKRDVSTFLRDESYTWHEMEDMRTLQLVPSYIHTGYVPSMEFGVKYTHFGGIGERTRIWEKFQW